MRTRLRRGRRLSDQHQRETRPRPARRLNRGVAVVDPEHHRHEDEALRPELIRERVDEVRERQDAVAADEPLRLHGEGDEGGKRDETEQAQEQERDEFIARRLVVPAPEHEACSMEGGTMRGDERVSPFGDGGETGQMAVESEPESFAGRVAQGQETGLGGAGAAPIGGDELHRALELGFRDGRILGRDLLIGPVFDLVAGQLLPVARPIGAEPAIAVIDELRARAGGSRLGGVGRRISGVLWHGIRDH